MTDDFKVVRDQVDEIFAEVEDSDLDTETKACLLGHLDDINISIDACLSVFAEIGHNG